MATPLTSSVTSRLGRPSRAEQAARQEALLDAALDIFLEHGFDGATVDEIAARVGMSKRTVYARHADKAALFRAAVHRAIDRYALSGETIEAVVGEDLEASLIAIARLRLANLATPNGVRLQRILSAQAYRFPDLFRAAFDEGAGPGVAVLVDLFRRHAARGETVTDEPELAALAFLSLVVGGPARMIVAGQAPEPAELERRIGFAVGLFLNGMRVRGAGDAPATTAGRA